jgi:MoaA/NifB/PqqE/SkfB family radical SAM enzyme
LRGLIGDCEVMTLEDGTRAAVLTLESAGSDVFAWRHPLGLRAVSSLCTSTEDGRVVVVDVSVLHLLECQQEVVDYLHAPHGPKLVVRLRGPLNFSERELARLAPGVTEAQLEAAITLLLRWGRETPGRFAASFEGAFVGLTPWTTIADLREHLDGIRRHGLAVDPLVPLSLQGPLADRARDEGLIVAAEPRSFRFRDERVGVLFVQPRPASASDAIERLEQALLTLEMPPKPRGKRLRLLPVQPEKGEQKGHIREVALTRECNLVCGFCSTRAPEPRTSRERAARAIAAVRVAASEGGSTLVLSGAEPTLEWYLDDLVTLARSLGFERVVLETNAVALAEPGRAQALADAGVTVARVAINSFDPALADRISGVDGALADTMRGARALLDAGVAVEIAVALLPANRDELARIIEQAVTRLSASKGRVERVVARVVHTGPKLGPPLSIADSAHALLEGARQSIRSGLPLTAAPGGELPPCVFDDLEKASPVLRVSEGVVNHPNSASLYARIPLCDGCGANQVCPGPRRGLERAVAAIARRVPVNAPGLPPTGERKRVLRELLSVVPAVRADGRAEEQRVIRVNFHCNQACDFCFVSRELPPPEDALIEREIAIAAQRGAALSLSGGEPTLNPRLLAYIARATELGITQLDLQTNAIKMSDASYASALASAGLKTAFVSLHGTTPATSDLVTRAPGTFVKTVQGVKNLLAAGVLARLNFVLCGHNSAEFAAWPDFVAREFRGIGAREVQINFSFAAASTHNVPRDTALLPRFSDVAWALEAALDRADALGIPLLGFDSQCGVPACFLPPRVREAFFAHPLPGTALADFSTAFRKGDACATCALTERCYGVRTAYAEMYGTSELRAIVPRA